MRAALLSVEYDDLVEADTMAIPAVAAAVRKLRRLMIAAATLAGLLVLPWLPGLFELKEFWPYARARTDATSPERLQPLFSSSLRSAVSNLRRTRRYQILFVVWACMPMWRLPSEVRSRVREMWSERGPRLCSTARTGPCTLNAVGFAFGRGDARALPPTHLKLSEMHHLKPPA